MADPRLIQYIRYYLSKGYSSEQIAYGLQQQGYPPAMVQEAFGEIYRPRSSKGIDAKKLIIALVIISIVLGGAAMAWYITKPVCGNGIVEKGETRDTCCEDTGCLGDQDCKDGRCEDPSCGECQYLQDHVCMDHECCSDDMCKEDEICNEYQCRTFNCSGCSYIRDHRCVESACCNDSDCDDNLSNTLDSCLEPAGPKAQCIHEEMEIACENLPCFIEKAKTCNESNITHYLEIDDTGVILKQTSLFEVKGGTEEKCNFYVEVLNNTVTLTDDFVEKMKAQGLTDREIDKMRRDSARSAKSTIGIFHECTMPAQKITDLLNRWKDGHFSSEDLSDKWCWGNYENDNQADTDGNATDDSTNTSTNTSSNASTKNFQNLSLAYSIREVDSLKQNRVTLSSSNILDFIIYLEAGCNVSAYLASDFVIMINETECSESQYMLNASITAKEGISDITYRVIQDNITLESGHIS